MTEIRRAKIEDALALRALLESMLREDALWIRMNVRHLGKEGDWIQNIIKDDRVHSVNGGKFFFFAFDEERLVGYVNGMSWAHAPLEVFNRMVEKHGLQGERPGHVGIAVHKDYRRQGLGTRLIEKALQELREMGATTVTSAIHVDNKPALSFFRKMGFTVYKKEKLQIFVRRKISGANYLRDC